MLNRNRGRTALSLVEVLVAIIIVSVALVFALEAFTHTLKLSAESSRQSRELFVAYTQFQKAFFHDLSSPPAGVQLAPIVGTAHVVFGGAGTSHAPLPLKRYDVGEGRLLRLYRP